MIKGTIIKNGEVKLVLTGSDEIDAAVLKQLNGATCTLITDNLRIGDESVSNGLIIRLQPTETKSSSEEITPQ